MVAIRHPDPGQEPAYRELDGFAAVLDAEVRVFHAAMTDPTTLPPASRARVGTGFFVPQNTRAHANDVEHFRTTMPARFDRLVAALGEATDSSAAGVLVQPEMQAACGFARWIQGWHADLIGAHGLGDGSLIALVAAWLLELPHFLCLDARSEADRFASLLPLHLQRSNGFVVADEASRRSLAARFGDALRDRIAVRDAPDAALGPRALLARALATPRPADSPAMGPAAAFATRPSPPTGPGPCRPFVVLGAERTGSNMLVGMLACEPRLACVNEIFNHRLIDAGRLPWLGGQDTNDPELLRLRQANPGALLHRLRTAAATGGAAWAGFKLLYPQAIADDRVVDSLAGDPDIAIVHLLRADRLRRWVSLLRARAEDRWYEAAGDPGSVPTTPTHEPLMLDVVETITEFAVVELMTARFRALFRRHRVLELDYDDMRRDLAMTSRSLSKLFGVELGSLVPTSRKTGGEDLSRAIGNLDQLRRALAGTPWELGGVDAP